MTSGSVEFNERGALHHARALPPDILAVLVAGTDPLGEEKPGVRLTGTSLPMLPPLLSCSGWVGSIAASHLGPTARPVRAVLFDKSPTRNWALGWHQDRTIVVRRRVEAPGFGPWSRKQGQVQVTPPADLLTRMITLRVHLDPCGEDNAPLLIAEGSHRLGRVPASEARARALERPILTCIAAEGDIWAYATLILHASPRAARPSRRRVLQVDYAREDLPGGLEWTGLS